MMSLVKRAAGAAAIASLALALGGCQVLGIAGPRTSRAAPDTDAAAIAGLGRGQLAAGREALVEGRTIDAINALMIAKSFPEHAPAAYNGLAVAYSRLGREDLAERFFLAAVALCPEDRRYRSNLALFYVRQGLPRDGGTALAFTPVEPAVGELPALAQLENPAVGQAVVRPIGGGIIASRPLSRLQRVSAGEVRIGSAPREPAVAVAGARRAVIEVGGKAPPPAPGARVAAAVRRPAQTAGRPPYPIRIPLSD